jgi:hypothetical protein
VIFRLEVQFVFIILLALNHTPFGAPFYMAALVDPQLVKQPLIQLAPCHNKPMLRQFTSNLLLLMKWFALFVAWASIILRFGGVGGR